MLDNGVTMSLENATKRQKQDKGSNSTFCAIKWLKQAIEHSQAFSRG